VTDGQFIVTPNFENQAIPIDIGDAPTRLLTRNADGSVRATPIATDVIPTQYTFNGVFFTEAYTNGHIALKYYDVHTLTAYPITNPDLPPIDAPRRVEIRHFNAPDVIRVRFIYSGDLSEQYRIRLNLPNTQPSAPPTAEPDPDTALTQRAERRIGQAVAVRVERDLVLNLRTDPSENAEVLAQLPAGTSATINDANPFVDSINSSEWWSITLADGTSGWVLAQRSGVDFVRSVDPADTPCTLTTLFGVNLRVAASTEAELVFRVEADKVLVAVSYENAADGFRWWALDTGEWVREDLVSASDGCAAIGPANSFG